MAGAQIRKHSVSIRGHRTSITLEDAFMESLRQMAEERGMALAALIADIDGAQQTPGNLSSALRLAVLDWALSARDARVP
ncbi:MAG: ribbon-helix-helix domain-containing protein [Hoeflea sp.]|nr:ribbon-helix-helix domain-containing protein [Hoeflea sp.]